MKNMKPDDGLSNSSTVFEVEISPSEFFQDVGVLIVENRIPEISKNGRRTGVHAWPITKHSKKQCCDDSPKSELCQLVASARANIQQTFTEKQSLFIEVFGTLNEGDRINQHTCRVYLEKLVNKSQMILLERWEIKLLKKKFCGDLEENVNVNMALQAVRSYLHFSQLSSWWSSTQGKFPHAVIYRMSSSGTDSNFLKTPSHTHNFPSTEISLRETIQISVQALPRMNISELSFLLKQEKNILTFDGGGPSKDNSKKKIETQNFLKDQPTTSFSEYGCSSSKRKDDNLDSYCMSYNRSTSCQQNGYAGEKHRKLDTEPDNDYLFPRTRDSDESSVHEYPSSSLNIFQKSSLNNEKTDNISSSSNGQMSLSQLLEAENNSSKNGSCNNGVSSCSNGASTSPYMNGASCSKDESLSGMLEDFDKMETGEDDCTEEDDDDSDNDDLDAYSYDNEFTPDRLFPQTPELCQKRRVRSKSVSPHFILRQKPQCSSTNAPSKPLAARRLAMVAGTVPIFNQKTGLPLSSSPAPIKKPRKISESSCNSSLSKSSSLDDIHTCASGLSKSAPAPSSLLGNFEESVLNGRMPANGTLEGFWAELGASGTFCPKHINLPMNIQYFLLSDDNAPSPYLGRITLRDKKKRKRYRVPRKGTVQLTIFNPNKTVVKVFVVLYNFEDMPEYSRTFVRQKIVSASSNNTNDLPTLHYLIHLSFVSSKSSHVYLHSDIRVLFRQRAPDEPLRTITNGPSNPKYTPITKKVQNGGSGIHEILVV